MSLKRTRNVTQAFLYAAAAVATILILFSALIIRVSAAQGIKSSNDDFVRIEAQLATSQQQIGGVANCSRPYALLPTAQNSNNDPEASSAAVATELLDFRRRVTRALIDDVVNTSTVWSSYQAVFNTTMELDALVRDIAYFELAITKFDEPTDIVQFYFFGTHGSLLMQRAAKIANTTSSSNTNNNTQFLFNETCLFNARLVDATKQNQQQPELPRPTLNPTNAVATSFDLLANPAACANATALLTRLDARLPGSVEQALVADADWPIVTLSFFPSSEATRVWNDRIIALTSAEWSYEICTIYIIARPVVATPQPQPTASPGATLIPVPPPVQTANPNGETAFRIFVSSQCAGTTNAFLARLRQEVFASTPAAMDAVVVLDSEWPQLWLWFATTTATANEAKQYTDALLQLTAVEWSQKLCVVHYYTVPYVPTPHPQSQTPQPTLLATPEPTTATPQPTATTTPHFPPQTASPTGQTEFLFLVSTQCAPTVEVFCVQLARYTRTTNMNCAKVNSETRLLEDLAFVVDFAKFPVVAMYYRGPSAVTNTNNVLAKIQPSVDRGGTYFCILQMLTRELPPSPNLPPPLTPNPAGVTLLAAVVLKHTCPTIASFRETAERVLHFNNGSSSSDTTQLVVSASSELTFPFITFWFTGGPSAAALTDAFISMIPLQRASQLCTEAVSTFRHYDPQHGRDYTATAGSGSAPIIALVIDTDRCGNTSQFLQTLGDTMSISNRINMSSFYSPDFALHQVHYPFVEISFRGAENATRTRMLLNASTQSLNHDFCVQTVIGASFDSAGSSPSAPPKPTVNPQPDGETEISVIVKTLTCHNSLEEFKRRLTTRFVGAQLTIDEVHWPYVRFRFASTNVALQHTQQLLQMAASATAADELHALCIDTLTSSPFREAATPPPPTDSQHAAAEGTRVSLTAAVVVPCLTLLALIIVLAFVCALRKYSNSKSNNNNNNNNVGRQNGQQGPNQRCEVQEFEMQRVARREAKRIAMILQHRQSQQELLDQLERGDDSDSDNRYSAGTMERPLLAGIPSIRIDSGSSSGSSSGSASGAPSSLLTPPFARSCINDSLTGRNVQLGGRFNKEGNNMDASSGSHIGSNSSSDSRSNFNSSFSSYASSGKANNESITTAVLPPASTLSMPKTPPVSSPPKTRHIHVINESITARHSGPSSAAATASPEISSSSSSSSASRRAVATARQRSNSAVLLQQLNQQQQRRDKEKQQHQRIGPLSLDISKKKSSSEHKHQHRRRRPHEAAAGAVDAAAADGGKSDSRSSNNTSPSAGLKWWEQCRSGEASEGETEESQEQEQEQVQGQQKEGSSGKKGSTTTKRVVIDDTL